MGTANVITDILLVVFPIPIIIRSQMGFKRKLQLVALFATSLLPAGTTLYRVPNTIDRHGSQQYRSLLASVEILFATTVANALILGSFVRDRGVKKQRWKLGSLTDSLERTASRRGTFARQWGSDEDLVRDVGIGVDPELRGTAWNVPRPAPMAVEGNMPVKRNQPEWAFPPARSYSDEMAFPRRPEDAHTGPDFDSIPPHRKVSFFDVGGLLEADLPRRWSSGRTDTDGESSTHVALEPSWSQEDGLSPPPARRGGSTALLQDLGGLLGSHPPARASPRGYELQTLAPPYDSPSPHRPHDLTRQPTANSLQDVGGLLR
jgi:hypothetical protein